MCKVTSIYIKNKIVIKIRQDMFFFTDVCTHLLRYIQWLKCLKIIMNYGIGDMILFYNFIIT